MRLIVPLILSVSFITFGAFQLGKLQAGYDFMAIIEEQHKTIELQSEAIKKTTAAMERADDALARSIAVMEDAKESLDTCSDQRERLMTLVNALRQ